MQIAQRHQVELVFLAKPAALAVYKTSVRRISNECLNAKKAKENAKDAMTFYEFVDRTALVAAKPRFEICG